MTIHTVYKNKGGHSRAVVLRTSPFKVLYYARSWLARLTGQENSLFRIFVDRLHSPTLFDPGIVLPNAVSSWSEANISGFFSLLLQ